MTILDPKVTVLCDKCGDEETFGLTATTRGWDDRDLAAEMRAYGWVTVGNNQHLCETCAEELGADHAD